MPDPLRKALRGGALLPCHPNIKTNETTMIMMMMKLFMQRV